MEQRLKIGLCAYITGIISIVLPKNGFAYIDPNTGGFFFKTIAPLLYIVGIIIIPCIFWFWALIDILKNEFIGSNKVIWLLLVIFIPVLGFVLYFLIGRKQKVRVALQT